LRGAREKAEQAGSGVRAREKGEQRRLTGEGRLSAARGEGAGRQAGPGCQRQQAWGEGRRGELGRMAGGCAGWAKAGDWAGEVGVMRAARVGLWAVQSGPRWVSPCRSWAGFRPVRC